MDTEIRVSTESRPWRRKLSRHSSRDSNPWPFNHESGALTTELSPPPTLSQWRHCPSSMIQAGVLTPLTFARHRLSPLVAFTSSAYFIHNGRQWQWIWEFYTVNFKGIFGGLSSQCVWQQAIECPKTHFFHELAIFWSARKRCRHFFPPSIPFPGNFCNCNNGSICTASQFYVQLPLLHTV